MHMRTRSYTILPITLLILALSFGLAACEPMTRSPSKETASVPQQIQIQIPTEELIHPANLVATAVVMPGSTPTLQLPPPTLPPPTETATFAPADTLAPTALPAGPLRIAVIGDFGLSGGPLADVANLIKSWAPDFIVTTGDNNYPSGAANTIDENIGQYFHEYIFPYNGQYGQGADQYRFFPSLGNHDWDTAKGQAYLDYFTLPGNERYYDFTWGSVHFFIVNSDSREPDGVSRKSVQAQWLQEGLARSTSTWRLVIFHAPPYSSGYHGSVDWMRWPFQEWGATAVLAGHDHVYERIILNGFPYFTNGLGGGPIYDFIGQVDGSQVRYNSDYGAMLITASEEQITFQFFNRSGELIDEYTINAN